MIKENRQEHSICSGVKFSYISGYELCGDLNFPNASLVENAPYFPLTGPVSAGLTLYKRDKQMKGYKIEARSTHVRLSMYTTQFFLNTQKIEVLSILVSLFHKLALHKSIYIC